MREVSAAEIFKAESDKLRAANAELVEALEYVFGSIQNEMVSQGLPLEGSPSSGYMVAKQALAKYGGKPVSEIQAEIARLNLEIEAIQAECSHENYRLVMWSWRPGAFCPKRLCRKCLKPLPEITEEESNAVWDGWNKK